MSLLFDVSPSAGPVTEAVSGAALAWPDPVALTVPVDLPVLGHRTHAVTPAGALPVPLGAAPRLLPTLAVTTALDLGSATLTGPGLVVDVGALRLSLLPQGDGTLEVRATAVTVAGERSVSRLGPRPSGSVELCAAVADGALVLVVEDVLAGRRPLESALVPVAASGTVGARADGTELLAAPVLALRVADDLPATVATRADDAASAGVGEVDAYAARTGSLGAPVEDERAIGLVRWRRFRSGTVVWTAATGTHAVTGPIEDRYWELGGPLGVLGALVGPEEALSPYLDTQVGKLRKPGAGLRWEDLVVERVPQPPRVVDYDVEPESLRRRLTGLLDARPVGEAAVSPAAGTVTGLAASVLATEGAVLRRAGVDVSPEVLAAVAALNDGRVRLGGDDGSPFLRAVIGDDGTPLLRRREEDEGLAVVIRRAGGGGPGGGRAGRGGRFGGLLRGVPHEEPVLDVEPAVVEEVASVATAFVRHEGLAAAATRLGERASEMFGALDTGDVPLLVRAADRVGSVARVIDAAGVGWVLRGPRIARFERGIVVWAPGTGAVEVLTDIAVHWLRLGGTDGFLGLPVERDTAVAGGRRVRFAGGTVYWSPETGGHEVHGDVLARYEAFGGPGALGFPTTDERDCPGGRMSAFQGGDVYWSPGTGAHVVVGAIREAYLRTGGPAEYGLPTTDEYTWTAGDGSGVSLAASEFSSGRVLAWTSSHGVFDHVVLDLGSVRSGDIDDEVTSDDQPELFVRVKVWVNGTEVVSGRTPGSGYGATTQQLDGYAPVVVPLRVDGSVRLVVEAHDEDTGPDDHFATHDATYTFGGDLFGWLDAARGSHVDAPSTWDSGDAGPGTFTTSYTLAPPFDELARFAEFRSQMFFGFRNFTTDDLGWDLYAATFEDVVETNDNVLEDLVRLDDSMYYKQRYRDVAEKGNCFGFSTAASNTFHRRTGLSQPLVQHGRDDDTNRLINLGQGLQTNEAVTLLRQLQFAVAGVIDPRRVFDRVAWSVQNGQPILLCMKGLVRAPKQRVGHCTVAYRVDGSSWPRRIWVADSNFPPPGTTDDQSRIEVDADGAWRMFEGSDTASATYGAGRWTGALGDSFVYDTPLGFVQPPNYTPSWLVRSGLVGVMASIFVADGAVSVDQVSGGGHRVFGDQRARLVDGLRSGVAHLESARAEGLLGSLVRPERVVPAAATPAASSAGLLAIAEAVALGDHVGSLTVAGTLSSSLGAAVEHWAAAESSFGERLHGTLDDHVGAIGSVIDDIVVDAVLEAARTITPGAWPGMAYVPVVEQTDSEMFALRGLPPTDLVVELRGEGDGDWSQSAMSRSTGALASGRISNRETRTVGFDRLASQRPGVRVRASQDVASELLLTTASDLATDHWLAWQCTLGGAAGRDVALERDGSMLGVRLTTASDAPVTLRALDRVRDTIRSDARWRVDGLAGATITVEPADPASPFGSRTVRRFDPGGALLDDLVVDPLG